MFRLDGPDEDKSQKKLQLWCFFICFPLVLFPETFPDIARHGWTVGSALLAASDALETLLLGFGDTASPRSDFVWSQHLLNKLFSFSGPFENWAFDFYPALWTTQSTCGACRAPMYSLNSMVFLGELGLVLESHTIVQIDLMIRMPYWLVITCHSNWQMTVVQVWICRPRLEGVCAEIILLCMAIVVLVLGRFST